MKKLLLAFAFATTLSVTATIGQAQQIPTHGLRTSCRPARSVSGYSYLSSRRTQ